VQPVALTIAGSDPSGGAGLQADLKTFQRFGVYGEAVITLITVQNTQAVSRVETLAPELVAQQIRAVVCDIPPKAIKTGALGTAEVIEAVADLAASVTCPLVVDPVMISKHGARLISADAEQTLKRKLLRHTFLLTPNIPEAEVLTRTAIRSEEDMSRAAEHLLDFGCKAVLIKGGHLKGDPVDVLRLGAEARSFRGRRVSTSHTHGTGCVYSAAITAGLALGRALPDAISEAKQFVQLAIEHAPGLGHGIGPLNFFA
jgi:hydroxymethylpyrimidine/phosphomethylpyrimidine kinase